MTKSRYFTAFLLSSLTFFVLYFIFLSFADIKKIVKPVPTKVIKVALITPVKKTVKHRIKAKPIVTPTPIISPIIVKKLEKKEPKKLVIKAKKIIKKKIIKKKVLKKEIVKKKIIKKRIVKKKLVKKPVIKKPIETYIPPASPIYVAPKPILEPVVKTPPATQPKVKNDYHKKAFLRNVRSKIIANKKYPNIAKRRHIAGSVKVRFDITEHGQVNNIRFINGKRIFQKSIKQTLSRTFPMDIPANVKNKLPIFNISVVLHFNIK